MHPRSIILDGHAASGKSTIGHHLSTKLGYAYTKPFDGPIGAINKHLFDSGDMVRLESFRSSVIDFYCLSTQATPCVFDRLIPSSLSLLSEDQWPKSLPFASRTAILWCDAETTVRRLKERGRDIWTLAQHRVFVETFRRIATRYNLLLIDTATSDVGTATQRITSYLSSPGLEPE